MLIPYFCLYILRLDQHNAILFLQKIFISLIAKTKEIEEKDFILYFFFDDIL